MTFTLKMSSILQYAYNMFSSFSPLVYLYAGAGLAIWIIFKVINNVK
ncbi:hypothetical protein [Paenibacillus amylolyticus]|nr:hypothetical protein [Paenibacillus amylolyticus]